MSKRWIRHQVSSDNGGMRLKVGTMIATMTMCWLAVGLPATGQERIPPSDVQGKKLIRASEEIARFWDAGSMANLDLQATLDALQAAGYDGLVFTLASHDESKGYGVMTGQWWNCAVRREYEEFLPEIEAFQAVSDWGRITDNFTRTMPAVWTNTPDRLRAQDWFSDEDWDVILHNAEVMTRVIRDCGFTGIMLDLEQYAHHARGDAWYHPFSYLLYADSGYAQASGHDLPGYVLAGEEEPRSFAEVAAQIEERGRQYAEVLTREFPDLVLMVIPGMYEWSWRYAVEYGDGTMENNYYGLYAAFLDGLLRGLDDRATIVAGSETTYAYSQYKDMLAVRDAELLQAMTLSRYPDLARERVTFSVGLWTDIGYGPDRFSNTDVSVNHRDPERHLHAVHNALAASDEYAWQWGEMGDWLSPEPTPLMREYWAANVAAHTPRSLKWEPEPHWDWTDYSDYEERSAQQDADFWVSAAEEGWSVAVELPEYWKFLFDTEMLLRWYNYLSPTYNDSAWHYLSVLRPWQGQAVKANGPAVYRTRFEAPADLDPATQEIVLAFSGFQPGAPEATGWMDVRVNQRGYGMGHFVDVSDSIIPGAENSVAVRVINRSGPGGLSGHVRLLVRDRAPAAQ